MEIENTIEISSRNIEIWFLFTILNQYYDSYYRKYAIDFSTYITIHSNGSKAWYVNGKKHREGDKSAVIHSNGSKAWYVNGDLHRIEDPAVILSNGTKVWFRNGKIIK